MSQVNPPLSPGISRWRQHWPMLLTGMGLVALAVALARLWSDAPALLRLLLLGGGLILAAQAVILRLRQRREEMEERIESAAVIVLAGFTALLGIFATDKEWDSADTVLKALLIVAGIGAALVLMPGRFRRLAISLLAVFHFGGILTAVTMIAPPGSGQPAPFLATQAWVHVYRHHLNFLYMNNAYHFYSPEPGPPTLLWFKLNYSNGQSEWFKMPNREDSPVNLHYQRLLSITESCGNVDTATSEALQLFQPRRLAAGQLYGIPVHPGEAIAHQFQPPSSYSGVMIPPTVRRIAREHAHPADDPAARLVSLKFYRVRHNILPAGAMANGFDPLDKSLYYAFYLGEFLPDGRIVNFAKDPFLYWLIPIYYQEGVDPVRGHVSQINDCLERHADLDYNRETIEKAAREEQP